MVLSHRSNGSPMTFSSSAPRLAVDVGGTFTDVALEIGARRITAKVLTTPQAPEEGVLAGVDKAVAEAGVSPSDVGLIIHGPTLATNAMIERQGATTALITTSGHRDRHDHAQEHPLER